MFVARGLKQVLYYVKARKTPDSSIEKKLTVSRSKFSWSFPVSNPVNSSFSMVHTCDQDRFKRMVVFQHAP